MILLRDLLHDKIQKVFGEEMGGGQGDPDPGGEKYSFTVVLGRRYIVLHQFSYPNPTSLGHSLQNPRTLGGFEY